MLEEIKDIFRIVPLVSDYVSPMKLWNLRVMRVGLYLQTSGMVSYSYYRLSRGAQFENKRNSEFWCLYPRVSHSLPHVQDSLDFLAWMDSLVDTKSVGGVFADARKLSFLRDSEQTKYDLQLIEAFRAGQTIGRVHSFSHVYMALQRRFAPHAWNAWLKRTMDVRRKEIETLDTKMNELKTDVVGLYSLLESNEEKKEDVVD